MSKRARPNSLGILCACECGQLTNENHGKISKFVKGHSARKFKNGELRSGKVADAFYCLKRKYGLTYEAYYELLQKQNGVCAICGTDNPGNARGGRCPRMAVDHCHKTRKVRGLLCQSCNKGLGNLKDSPDVVEKAISYLKEYVG